MYRRFSLFFELSQTFPENVHTILLQSDKRCVQYTRRSNKHSDGNEKMSYVEAFKKAEAILGRMNDGAPVLTTEINELVTVTKCYSEPRHQGLRDRVELIQAKASY